MFVKLIFIGFALMILEPAQSAEILSKLQIDSSETSVLEPSIGADLNSGDDESTTITVLVPSVVTGSETAGGIENDLSVSNEESRFTSKTQTSKENVTDC